MKGRSRRRWLIAGIAAACLALALFLAACANTGTGTSSGDGTGSTAETSGTTTVQINVPDKSSGYFADTWNNTELLNAGNRGCDSCHADIWTLVADTTSPYGYEHLQTSAPGYGMHIRLSACLACHLQDSLLGPDLGDVLHNAHYGSADFVSRNGNCWSCHATVKTAYAYNHTGEASADGQQAQMLLWDDVKYTAGAAGFSTNANTDATISWLVSRGFTGGHMTSMNTDSAMDIAVELSQPVLDEKDMYVANNYGTQVIDGTTYTLSITGVKNPRTFTLDELKAMPATEMIVTQACGVNAPNGPLVGNIPVKGVSVEYLIEQCGGLLPGTVSVTTASWTDKADGSGVWAFPTDIEEITQQDALIAYEYFGHDLTNDQGYPCTLVYPGLMGGQWVKFPKTMDFSTAECPKPENHEMGFGPFAVTSGWFSPSKDGTVLTAGQEATLTGYSYTWAYPNNDLKQIKFSFDYGKTWKTYDVPADSDPNQWVVWTVKWTPPAAGSYVLKVNAVDAAGLTQCNDASVIVVVK